MFKEILDKVDNFDLIERVGKNGTLILSGIAVLWLAKGTFNLICGTFKYCILPRID
jgi:hypothetical protein